MCQYVQMKDTGAYLDSIKKDDWLWPPLKVKKKKKMLLQKTGLICQKP